MALTAAQKQNEIKKALIIAQLSKTPTGRAMLATLEARQQKAAQEEAIAKQEEAEKRAQGNAIAGMVAAPVGTMAGYWALQGFPGLAGAGTAAAAGSGAAAASAGAGAATAGTTGAGLAGGLGATGAGAAAGGAAAGTGAAATGTAATGAGTGAASGGAAGYGAYAWPVAAALGIYQGAKNYREAKKNANGGAMTDDEVTSVYSPFRGSVDKYKNKIAKNLGPLSQPFKNWVGMYEKLADYSPVGLAAKALLGSSKHEDQIMRDRVRSRLQDGGVIGDDYLLQMKDGSSFDMGRDGGYRDDQGLRNFELNHDAPTKDFQGQTIGYVNPLAEILTGGNDKLRSDTAGMYAKASIANAPDAETARQNALDLYKKHGIDQQGALKAIDEMEKQGGVTAEEAAAYRGGIGQLFSGAPVASPAPQAPPALPANTQGMPRTVQGQAPVTTIGGPAEAARVTPGLANKATGAMALGQQGATLQQLEELKREEERKRRMFEL